MYATILKIRDGWEERIEGWAKKVQEVDSTFRWEFVQDDIGVKAFVVYSADLKQAHRRGIWVKGCFREMFQPVKVVYRIGRGELR
jgi:hypothetical protein